MNICSSAATQSAFTATRATGDIDFWVDVSAANAAALVRVLTLFGFGASVPSAEMFLTPDLNIRMGNPPLRIELLTGVSGVDFAH